MCLPGALQRHRRRASSRTQSAPLPPPAQEPTTGRLQLRRGPSNRDRDWAPALLLRLDEQRPMEPLSFRMVEPFPAE